MIEIGGTVGEYQNLLFLEAARMMKLYSPQDVLFVIVSYLPVPSKVGEMKTKPTQHAIRELNSAGIQPNFILARSQEAIDIKRREKIALNCNIEKEDVISAPDVDSIYQVPINYENQNLGTRILAKFGLKPKKKDLVEWRTMVRKQEKVKKEVNVAIVGKYFSTGNFSLQDSYISVI